MEYFRPVLLLCYAGLALSTGATQAADEDAFLGQMRPPLEQTIGQSLGGALWTLPLVATQYQPAEPTPAMQAAMQAQNEGRFLDALILLDEAKKKGQAGEETEAEMNLLRASFLLQGNQPRQAEEILTPLLANLTMPRMPMRSPPWLTCNRGNCRKRWKRHTMRMT